MDDTKRKINWGYITLKKLTHSKRNNHHIKRATYRMGKNICKPCIWKAVNLQNLSGIPMTHQQKKKKTWKANKKWERNKTFLQRRCTNGTDIWKKLNDANHQGNANQNHNAFTLHCLQDGYYQRKKKTHASENMEILEPLYTTTKANIKQYSHYGRQCRRSS